jgi:hypothetical protein
MKRLGFACVALALLIAAPVPAAAQAVGDPAAIERQKQAMGELSWMNGIWRGKATIVQPGGTIELVQTERVGDMLDGAVKLVEGRGYRADGSRAFNAFAMISFDPATGRYTMRSHAEGRYGEFSITPMSGKQGLIWEIPAGPATIRYTIWLEKGRWREYGERIVAGQPPFRFIEMDLVRLGNSKWPSAGSVQPK